MSPPGQCQSICELACKLAAFLQVHRARPGGDLQLAGSSGTRAPAQTGPPGANQVAQTSTSSVRLQLAFSSLLPTLQTSVTVQPARNWPPSMSNISHRITEPSGLMRKPWWPLDVSGWPTSSKTTSRLGPFDGAHSRARDP